jgi:hypothetical protein
MTNRGLTGLGGACAILSGALLPLTAIAYLLMPPAQQSWADPAAYLLSFAQAPTFAMIEYTANVLIAVLSLGVVVSIPHVLRPVHEGWLRWATTVAIVGNSVNAIQYIRELSLIPAMADRFLLADSTTRAATAASLYLVPLDIYGWLTYGAIGAWLLAVNILALPGSRWPRTLSWIGIAGGIDYWLVVAGPVLRLEALSLIASIAGVVLGPIWFVWMGLFLRRSSR